MRLEWGARLRGQGLVNGGSVRVKSLGEDWDIGSRSVKVRGEGPNVEIILRLDSGVRCLWG